MLAIIFIPVLLSVVVLFRGRSSKADISVVDMDETPVETIVSLCPSCQGSMRFIEQYSRHYCDSCGLYGGTNGVDAPVEKTCPDCGGAIRYIDEYQQYFCDSCQKYPSLDQA